MGIIGESYMVNHLREFKGQSTLCNVLSTHMQQTD